MISPAVFDAALLALFWILYFCVHSLQASLSVKTMVSQRLPAFMPYYRLMFNFVAIVLLAAPLWLLYAGEKVALWSFTGVSFWMTQTLALAAVIGFLVSTRYYDGREFLGLRQLADHETTVENREGLCLSPFHRYVRHPWYSFALVLIWTRPMDSLMLTSAIAVTVYLFTGSRLEEKKLLIYYGSVYGKYRCMVPGLLPVPWKYLKSEDVDTLTHEYHSTQTR